MPISERDPRRMPSLEPRQPEGHRWIGSVIHRFRRLHRQSINLTTFEHFVSDFDVTNRQGRCGLWYSAAVNRADRRAWVPAGRSWR
jgi:hypothetical protein